MRSVCETTKSDGKLETNSIFSQGLVIANLNITSLPKHIDELRVFISISKSTYSQLTKQDLTRLFPIMKFIYLALN